MITSHRLYNALRRIAGPCTAYRIARAVRQFKEHMHSTATWAFAIALTLGVGAMAGHESTATVPANTTIAVTGQP
jgi:hypothetical protein